MCAGDRSVKPSHNRIWYGIGIYFFILIYYFAVFHVVTESGFSADDMWNSNIWTFLYTGEGGPWYQITTQYKIWLHLGRFFPISNLAPIVYMVCRSLLSYKLAIIAATYINNLICSRCIRDLTKHYLPGYLYMLVFPILIQLTPEFDSGIFCYHLLIQTVTLFGFLSMYGIMKYIDSDNRWYAFFSAICLLCALCTYEVGFIFIVPMIYIAYSKTKNIKLVIRYVFPDGIVYVVMCIWNLLVRILYQTGNYDGISIRFDIKAIIVTLLKQCSTCIPLGRYICAYLKQSYPYSDVYPYTLSEIIRNITIWDIVSVIMFLMLYICCIAALIREKDRIEDRKFHVMIICGLLIWVCPGILIAISQKYQQSLGWCSGHLPAYLQSLGFAMLVTGVVLLIWTRLERKHMKVILACLCCGMSIIILLLNQASGRAGVRFMNGFRKYPQENIMYASEAGMFDSFEKREDMVLVGTTSYIYDNNSCRHFYMKFIKKNLYAVTRQEFLTAVLNTEGDISDMDNAYYGIFNMADQDSGALIMGKCVELGIDEESAVMEHMWIENPLIYIRGDGKRLAGVDTSEWQLVSAGDGYEIYTISGRYDIIQSPEYYQSELNTAYGRLYQ